MELTSGKAGQTAKGTRDLLELGPNRLKLLVIELRAKLAAQSATAAAPIAIIGLSGRYPSAGDDVEGFWALLHDRRVAAQARHPGFLGPGYNCLDQVDAFDPAFFGITPEDAMILDPQQRLLIETAWRAMEDAGRPPTALGRRTGVFVALCSNDYAELIRGSGPAWPGRAVIGNSHGLAAGRLSNLFGFDGPSLAVDTACSSSLTAAHLAIGQLRAGACDAALVGGVSVLLSPLVTADLNAAGLLSRDGLCRPFDAHADGYVRGEGCGVLVLKRLADAERDGDRIRARIRGSAVNNDGSGMLLAPSARAQRQVMRAALENARVQPDEVDLLEASSIGARFADPVEAEALKAVYGGERPVPLAVGSVKANIGHLEAAAGVAALTKAVLSLEHQAVPGHATFAKENPHLYWDEAIAISAETRDAAVLPRPLRFVGVSGFSLSGANAHLILERAPVAEPAVPASGPVLLALGARSEAGLRALAADVAARLRADPDALLDLCFTLAAGRSPAPWRAARRVAAAASAVAWLDGADFVPTLASAPPRFAVVVLPDAPPFPDQLLERAATEARAECDAAWQRIAGESAQTPAAVAAFRDRFATLWLLEAVGCQPALLSGSGAGEIAAATAAGLFELEAGLRLAAVPESTLRVPFSSERLQLIAWPEARTARRGELARERYWRGDRRRDHATLVAAARTAGAELVMVLCERAALVGSTETRFGDLLDLTGALYLHGFNLEWRRLFAGTGARIVAAPPTPFERRRLWVDGAVPAAPPLGLPVLSAEEATEALTALLCAELDLDSLAPDQNLLELDISSVELVQLLSKVHDMTGLRPPVGAVYANPTVAGLVALYLAEQQAPEREVIWI